MLSRNEYFYRYLCGHLILFYLFGFRANEELSFCSSNTRCRSALGWLLLLLIIIFHFEKKNPRCDERMMKGNGKVFTLGNETKETEQNSRG
jgi:hypothetical protein